MTDVQVAVLGGGISGVITACLLADAGIRVAIVEEQAEVLDGASRWNDGKLHLGYTFTGTPSLATAALMQEGAAVFFSTVRRILGGDLPEDAIGRAVVYLVDPRSMVSPAVLWQRAGAVARLLERSMDRWPDLREVVGRAALTQPGSLLERIEPAEAMASTAQSDVVDAWRVTELHVATRVLADALVSGVRERGIPVIHARVDSIRRVEQGWEARTASRRVALAQVVVNATWQDRRRLDLDVTPTSAPVSIRYKLGLFGRGTKLLRDVEPSTRILGRFGDIAAYPNGDAYLSWYPSVLVARSDDGRPPALPAWDDRAITAGVLSGLGLAPCVLEDPGATWSVRGGHIVAHGHGDIDDPASPLHERAHPAVRELAPGYVSVDTGKLTLGPLMARRAAALVRRRLATLADTA